MRPLALATALLATSCFITGCSRSQAATIAGTYTLDAEKTITPIVDAQAKMLKLDDAKKKTMTEQMKRMMHASLELNEDMTFAGAMKGPDGEHTLKGTWKVTGNKITLDQTHENGKERKETQVGTIKDGVVAITKKEGSQEMTLYFNKGK